MALRRYEYYPASPESIRGTAGRVRAGSTNLNTVIERVAGEHRSAVGMTQGELFGPMSQGFVGPYRLSSTVVRRALWAAAQLEVFADAIETYNRDSSDPMSIEKLNAKVDLVSPAHLCVPVPGSDATQAEWTRYNDLYQQRIAEYQADLDTHFVRLEANLDEAAGETAQALRHEPSDADIIAAWKAGNLPASAAAAWPELGLNCIPINGVGQDLLGLTEQQILDRLKDPTKALSDAELEWLAVSYPRLMRQFHEQWTFEDTVVLSPDQPPAGHEGEASPHGWVLGPDGRWYPIQIPQRAEPPPGVQTVGEVYGGLLSGNGSWVTLDSRQGPIEAGEPIMIVPFFGGTPKLYGNLSVGENQTDYLTYDTNGNVFAHQQAPDKSIPWGIPRSLPEEPELNNAPPGTWDPTQQPNPMRDHVDTVGAALDATIGTLEGIQLNNQLEANRHYAGNVTFQVSGDERRAVIQLAQLTYDQDTGKVVDDPFRTYGVVNEHGQLDQYVRD